MVTPDFSVRGIGNTKCNIVTVRGHFKVICNIVIRPAETFPGKERPIRGDGRPPVIEPPVIPTNIPVIGVR